MGPYDLLDYLGGGGMGAVYRSLHTVTGQVVAVKVMSADRASDPLLLKRFRKEYSVASRLSHPNIVRALDFGIDNGQPYIAMEYVEGKSLGQHVRSQGPLPEAEAFHLIRQLADALHLAHNHRLIHRDVKPDNVLLTAAGHAKLTDLGLIKDLDASTILTKPRASLGTISFMAPEQFEGAEHADPRCDVYGLAGTLYYALTGVVPFLGRGHMSVLQKKLRNEFAPPRRLLPSLPPEADEAICRALDASPSRRPASCAEFAALIGRGRAAAPADRRVARRFPSLLKARWHPPGGERPRPADILDISRTGVCLQLDRRVEPRDVFRVEAFDDKASRVHAWTVRVCWTQASSQGSWRVGGMFGRELAAEELDALMGFLAPTQVM
jgi:serine/threonine protein kinase